MLLGGKDGCALVVRLEAYPRYPKSRLPYQLPPRVRLVNNRLVRATSSRIHS